MKNPFVFDAIVTNDGFCNRRSELGEIQRAIDNAQKLLIFSERRLGKTSLVKYALSKLSPNDYIPIYVDLWSTDDELSFAKTYASAVAEVYSPNIQKIAQFARKYLPNLLPAVSLDEFNKPTLTFGVARTTQVIPELPNVLALPSHVAKASRKRVVVVLDEIQQILEYKNDTAERQLRSIIQQHDNIAYLFLGSRKHLIEQMFLSRQRPFYRSAAHLPLGPIEEKHWLPFIRNKFLQSHIQVDDHCISYICGKTHGHPRDTQHLCHVVCELAFPDRKVDHPLVDEAIDLILQREDYSYMRVWEMLTIDQRRTLAGIAVASSDTQLFSADFADTCGLKNPSTVQRTTKSLLNKDLIDIVDGKYYLTDHFFSLWIRKKISKTKR